MTPSCGDGKGKGNGDGKGDSDSKRDGKGIGKGKGKGKGKGNGIQAAAAVKHCCCCCCYSTTTAPLLSCHLPILPVLLLCVCRSSGRMGVGGMRAAEPRSSKQQSREQRGAAEQQSCSYFTQVSDTL
jgi:hypothetical protein